MLIHLLPLLFGSGCCLHWLWHRCRCWHCRLRWAGWLSSEGAAGPCQPLPHSLDPGLVVWLVPCNVALVKTFPHSSLARCLWSCHPSPAALDRPFLLGPVTTFTVPTDS